MTGLKEQIKKIEEVFERGLANWKGEKKKEVAEDVIKIVAQYITDEVGERFAGVVDALQKPSNEPVTLELGDDLRIEIKYVKGGGDTCIGYLTISKKGKEGKIEKYEFNKKYQKMSHAMSYK